MNGLKAFASEFLLFAALFAAGAKAACTYTPGPATWVFDSLDQEYAYRLTVEAPMPYLYRGRIIIDPVSTNLLNDNDYKVAVDKNSDGVANPDTEYVPLYSDIDLTKALGTSARFPTRTSINPELWFDFGNSAGDIAVTLKHFVAKYQSSVQYQTHKMDI